MKDRFSFRQFDVVQEGCAMKVGTDGVLLGSWANGGHRILDVGCGTGLIALMMAQRFPAAEIDAIDIDHDAFETAHRNVEQSPFSDRIIVARAQVQEWQPIHRCVHDAQTLPLYDAIVCNPPFFINSLQCPDNKRTVARHAETLTFSELMASAERLMAEEGEISVVIPVEVKSLMDEAAILVGLFPHRICMFRTTDRKPPRRVLLSYTKKPRRMESEEMVLGDETYRRLTGDFYL